MMNLKRTKRQIEAVNKWIQNKSHGTLEFATGVGKTNTAIIAIKKLKKLNNEITVDIVVPTRYLKVQLRKAGAVWK
jgi:superfamily II DNA or RNA helicase